MIADAFAFPFRNSGWMMIVLGSVLSVVLNILSMAPLIGFFVSFIGFAYFTAFYFDIISATVSGRDEAPEWPGISDVFSDIVMPVLRLVGIILISFLPLIVVGFAIDQDGNAFVPALLITIAMGAFYFPMALLNTVIYGEMSAVLPHRVLPNALGCMPSYLAAVVLLIVVLAASGFATELGAKIPILGWLLASAISIYCLMVQARMIGMIYRTNQEVFEGAGDES